VRYSAKPHTEQLLSIIASPGCRSLSDPVANFDDQALRLGGADWEDPGQCQVARRAAKDAAGKRPKEEQIGPGSG
jgi:hypothetical protein